MITVFFVFDNSILINWEKAQIKAEKHAGKSLFRFFRLKSINSLTFQQVPLIVIKIAWGVSSRSYVMVATLTLYLASRRAIWNGAKNTVYIDRKKLWRKWKNFVISESPSMRSAKLRNKRILFLSSSLNYYFKMLRANMFSDFHDCEKANTSNVKIDGKSAKRMRLDSRVDGRFSMRLNFKNRILKESFFQVGTSIFLNFIKRFLSNSR